MSFNFNFNGSSLLQALNAYQGQYSAAKAAATRQSQVMESQYQAQAGQAFGGGLASTINRNMDLSVYDPIRQQQQLNYARQYSQDITLPQMYAHFNGQQRAQQNEHLSNQFGPGVTVDNLPDIGRQQYLQGLYSAAASDNNDPAGAIGRYASQYGISQENASAPSTLNDNALMSRVGFHGLHTQQLDQQYQQQAARIATQTALQQQSRRAEGLQNAVSTGAMTMDPNVDPDLARQIGMVQSQMRKTASAPEYQGNPQSLSTAQGQLQQRLNTLYQSAPDAMFKKPPPQKIEELEAAGMIKHYPDGTTITIDPATKKLSVTHGLPMQAQTTATDWDSYMAGGGLTPGQSVKDPASGDIATRSPDGKHVTVSRAKHDKAPPSVPQVDTNLPAAADISQVTAGTHSFHVGQPVGNGRGGFLVLRGFSPNGSLEFEHINAGKEAAAEQVSPKDLVAMMKHLDVKADIGTGAAGHKATPQEAEERMRAVREATQRLNQKPSVGGRTGARQLPPRGTEPQVGEIYDTARGPGKYKGNGVFDPVQ